MKIETLVTTCPREDADYLPGCLESCEQAGLEPVHLFADHNSSRECEGAVASYHSADKRLWAWPNFSRGYRWMLRRDWDLMIYVQDDMLLSKNLADVLRQRALDWPDDCGIWSPYVADKSFSEPVEDRSGWWHLPDHRCPRGACCLVFRRDVVERFHEYIPSDKRKAGVEMRLWEAIKRAELRWYHYGERSYAQHIGAVSSMHTGMRLNATRQARMDWIRDASNIGAAELEATAEHSADH